MENNLEKALQKIKMIETEDVIKSIHVVGTGKTQKLIFDAHGFTARKAKSTINNLIALNKDGFTMEVIHGYNHGTVIKEIVKDTENNINKRVEKRKVFKHNPGVTRLEIVAV